MKFSTDVIYKNIPEEMRPLVPMLMIACKDKNVNTYLIVSIFKFELGKHPKLYTYNNPGNIKTEESQFMLPCKFDSMGIGISRYVRLIEQIIRQNDIYEIQDIQKLVRPLEPEWADIVSEYYSEILNYSIGR